MATTTFLSGRFLGRCKTCRGVVLVSEIPAERREASLGYGRKSVSYRFTLPSGVKAEGKEDWFSARCWCGGCAVFQKVVGRFSAKHTCDDRCTNAVGPACECSCAGANHGRSYGVAS